MVSGSMPEPVSGLPSLAAVILGTAQTSRDIQLRVLGGQA